MPRIYEIEDERHAEPQGEYATFHDAVAELRRRAALPWDEPPNRPPCTNWRTCRRVYEVIEYDLADSTWKELQRIPVLEVSHAGAKWAPGFGPS
jgi:hypothetical protein